MSSSHKTIKINPELFKFSKTLKNKEKKEKPNIPVIKPNKLKHKLLNRIKEHKNNEIKERDNISKISQSDDKFSDEFNDALSYLSEVSQQSKDEKKRNQLKNKTLKNYGSSMPYVELELPEELQEVAPVFSNVMSQPANTSIRLNYKVDNVIPYGVLKNGQKPTYRSYNATRKNNVSLNMGYSNVDQMIANNQQTSDKTQTRQEKLQQIKKKLKMIDEKINQEQHNMPTQMVPVNTPQNIIQVQTQVQNQEIPQDIDFNTNMIQIKKEEDVSSIPEEEPTQFEENNISNDENYKESLPNRYVVKKTIKRKFTLGKSTKFRKVGVLIKNKHTRKRILNAQKEMKKTSIADIKKYLKDRGIIKVGSIAPQDVLRKTYESAMLAGELTNINKDTLIHNYMNSTEEY